MADFPGAIDASTDHATGDTIEAEHVNNLQREVQAIETALGINMAEVLVANDNAGKTTTDLGVIVTMDLNGGTIDGATIGGSTPAAGTFTNLVSTDLATGFIQFDINNGSAGAEGKLMWNSTDGTLEVGLPGGNVNLQIGQEQVVNVRNTTGSTITNGQVVHVDGASGPRPLIVLSQSGDTDNDTVLGMATEDIANNQNGFVTIRGLVRDIDMSGFSTTDTVYLSTDAGGITATEPTGSNRVFVVGHPITTTSDSGIILVEKHERPFLSELSAVTLSSPSDNQALTYDNASGTWVNETIDHNQTVNTHNLTTDINHATILNGHNLTTDINHSTILNGHNLTTDINHNTILNNHNLTSDIDHDTITNTHNLTTDIDHNTVTNTHNLTTDIDHDQLTNYTVTEHFTMLDEDDMVSDSATQAATQQSIKAYVDNNAASTGWIDFSLPLTYASADDPTYTATTTDDPTGIISTGMKMKVTQGSTDAFFFVTAATTDTLTFYGGTDYDLTTDSITSPQYSTVKAPLDFPLDPDKWTVEVTDTTNRTQSTPTQNQWYNLNSSIDIPIGAWLIGYSSWMYVYESSGTSFSIYATLSTGNNTESDSYLTTGGDVIDTTGSHYFYVKNFIEKTVDLNTKTTYYHNLRTGRAGMNSINEQNSGIPLRLFARSAYL